MKRITVFLLAVLMVLAMVPAVALAAGTVEVSTPAELQSALSAASSGDTVKITADMSLTTQYVIKTGVTLTASPGVTVSVSGSVIIFDMQQGSTLASITVAKTDKTTQAGLVNVRANCVVRNCSFTGQYVMGDSEVARAMLIVPHATNVLVERNTISSLRQPAYIDGGASGQIKNNKIYGTRGWVVCLDSTCVFTGNVFGGNLVDFAIIKNGAGVNSGAYDDIAALSAANNGAYVEYQLTEPRLYASAGIAFPAGGGTTEVTAAVDPTYMIVIPAAVNFGTLQKGLGDRAQAFDVTAQDVIIEAGKSIDVSVASDFKLASGTVLLDYELFNGGSSPLTTGGTFASFYGDGTQAGSVVVDTDLITKAGSYLDTMTFTISYQ